MGSPLVLRGVTTAVSAAVSLSPVFDTLRIHRDRSTGPKSALPLIAYWCNGHIWMWYGLLTGTYFPIVATSVFGQTCALAFLSVFYYHSDDRARVRRMALVALAFVCPVVAFVACTIAGATGQSVAAAAQVMGGIGDAFAIVMLGSPLEKLKVVVASKSARALPVPLCCMCLVNTSLWLSFGLTTGDVFVITPNCFGVVLCSIQVALCVVYRGGGGSAVEATDPELLEEGSDLAAGERGDCRRMEEDLRSLRSPTVSPKSHEFESAVAQFAALRSPSPAARVATAIA